jgi:hypothetical protein
MHKFGVGLGWIMKNNTRIDCIATTTIHLMLALFIMGCTVARSYRDEPGADVNSVRPSINQTQVEAILGKPIRCWQSSTGIRYCLYEYDAGVKGSGGDAAALAFVDAITLGLFELFASMDSSHSFRPQHGKGRIIISYDVNNMVLGTFGEFDELPPDGRSISTGTSNRNSD